jgi:hypothetical protein
MGIFFAFFQNLGYSEKQKNLTDSKVYTDDVNLSFDDIIEAQEQELLLFELGRYNFWIDE